MFGVAFTNGQPDVPGVENRTALHWAAYQGKHKFVKVLLSYDADINVRDSDGRYDFTLVRF